MPESILRLSQKSSKSLGSFRRRPAFKPLTDEEKWEQWELRRLSQLQARARQKIKQDAQDLQWMRQLEIRLAGRQLWITLLAIAGLLGAILIRERCEATADVNASCQEGIVVFLKFATTIMTVHQVALMWANLSTRNELAGLADFCDDISLFDMLEVFALSCSVNLVSKT